MGLLLMTHPKNHKNRIRAFFEKLGPGFITGAADDDPSGIATYAQTGAKFGYGQLWTALFSFPFMVVVQEMCGRIGLVTGNGLAGVIKKHYSRPLLYGAVLLLLFANTVNIGADLGAMAAAAQLLVPLPFPMLMVGLVIFTLSLEVFVSYRRYAKILKFFALSLLSYVLVSFLVRQDWGAVVYSTFIPTFSFSREYLMNIVAVLGTTISPYLFFWQTGEEVEEEINTGKITEIGVGTPRLRSRDIFNMRYDTVVGMFFSNLIMFFIMTTTATTLRAQGITHIETATQAAVALRPLAGDFSSGLFAIGIIGIGLLAVPILGASASYAVAESVGWRGSLSLPFKQARGFYGVMIFSTLIGLLINFLGVQPFTMLYYTAILNGIVAPPLIFLILFISNNRKIMGTHTNSLFTNIMGIFIAVVMAGAGVLLITTSFLNEGV